MFTCGATRLGVISHPLSAYNHMPNLLTEIHLRLSYSAQAFLIALRSPFSTACHTALHQPTALCDSECRAYSLFFNGLAKYSIKLLKCQAGIEIFFTSADGTIKGFSNNSDCILILRYRLKQLTFKRGSGMIHIYKRQRRLRENLCAQLARFLCLRRAWNEIL